AAAAYSHRADKVSECVPLVPTTANAVHRDVLSHAVVLVLSWPWHGLACLCLHSFSALPAANGRSKRCVMLIERDRKNVNTKYCTQHMKLLLQPLQPLHCCSRSRQLIHPLLHTLV